MFLLDFNFISYKVHDKYRNQKLEFYYNDYIKYKTTTNKKEKRKKKKKLFLYLYFNKYLYLVSN